MAKGRIICQFFPEIDDKMTVQVKHNRHFVSHLGHFTLLRLTAKHER